MAVGAAPWPTSSRSDIGRAGSPSREVAPDQAALRLIRGERGDHSTFLADMSPLEARDWLVRIDGIGKERTTSVLLMFSFGMPLAARGPARGARSSGGSVIRPGRPRTTPATCSLASSSPEQALEASTSSSTAG